MRIKRNYIEAVFIVVLLWTASACVEQSSGYRGGPGSGKRDIERAFETRTSNVQVESEGIVDRILDDDRAGSRHQRFIIHLESGMSVLIVHNIDIAPRVANLGTGDRIRFFGEYVWNSQGGLVHWTHHDPEGRHVAGWLKYKERTYQ